MESQVNPTYSPVKIILGLVAAGFCGGLAAFVMTFALALIWSPRPGSLPNLHDFGGPIPEKVRAFGRAAEEYDFDMALLGAQTVSVLCAGVLAVLAAISGTGFRGLLIGAIGSAAVVGGLMYFTEIPHLRENRMMQMAGEQRIVIWAFGLGALAGGTAGLVGGLIGRYVCWAPSRATQENPTKDAGDVSTVNS